jgi:hypothetical protein
MTRTTLLALCLLGCSACVVEDSHSHVHALSTLTVDWTVDGTTDPAQCRQGGTPTLAITLETDLGHHIDDFFPDCEAFGTTIDVDPGSYQLSAVLLDDRGDERTTVVLVPPFDVFEGEDHEIPIDFPAEAFL